MTGLSISATGLQTAVRRQEVIAHNVANMITPGYRSLRADSVELQGGGSTIGSITRDPGPGPVIQGVEGSNVNLATEMVNTLVNRNAYQANVNAFRAQADLVGELLDLVE